MKNILPNVQLDRDGPAAPAYYDAAPVKADDTEIVATITAIC